MGDRRDAYRICAGGHEGRSRLEDQRVGGRVILEMILNKSVLRAWTGFVWLKIGPNGRLL